MRMRFRKGNKPDKALDPMEELGLDQPDSSFNGQPYNEMESDESHDADFYSPEQDPDVAASNNYTSDDSQWESEDSQPEDVERQEQDSQPYSAFSSDTVDDQGPAQDSQPYSAFSSETVDDQGPAQDSQPYSAFSSEAVDDQGPAGDGLLPEELDYQEPGPDPFESSSDERADFQDQDGEGYRPEVLDYQEEEPELTYASSSASSDPSPEYLSSAGYGSGAAVSRYPGFKGKLFLVLDIVRGRRFRFPKLPSNKRVVTLTTEKNCFRVVVFRGRRVVAWGSTPIIQNESAPPAPQDLEMGEELAESEESFDTPLSSLLKELSISRVNQVWRCLDKVGIRRGRTVMDLSLYTTLMRHLHIPRVRGRYLEPVVVAEVLDSVPFSKEEVDISWETQKDGETSSVFAVALPKNRLDSQVNMVKEAGLVPSAAYSKAAALSLASGIPNGVVVHLEEDESALVLVQGGEAKTVHQLEYSQAESTTEARTNAISRGIEQVASYFQPEHPQQLMAPLPVILTGRCDASHPVAQKLRSVLKREVLSVQPSIRCPEDFPIDEYAINVGLYLSDQVGNTYSTTATSGKSSSLNLLPARHRPQPVPVFQTAVFVTLFLLMVHPYNVVGRVDAKIQEKEAIAEELMVLRAQEREFDVVSTGFQKNQTAIEDASDRIHALETQMVTLNNDLGRLLSQLQTITGPALPHGVELSAIVPQDEDIMVLGTAGNHAQTLQYAVNLKESDFFEDARVTSVSGQGGTNPNPGGVVSFQIKMTLVSAPDQDAESEEAAE